MVSEFSHTYVFRLPLFLSDKSDESEPAVSAGAVDVVPASFRGDKWLPDGGALFCVQATSP